MKLILDAKTKGFRSPSKSQNILKRERKVWIPMAKRLLFFLLCVLLLGPLSFGLRRGGPSVRYSVTGTVLSADDTQVTFSCDACGRGGTPAGTELCYFWSDAAVDPPSLRRGDRLLVRHSGSIGAGSARRLTEVGDVRRLPPVGPPAYDSRRARQFVLDAAVVQAGDGCTLIKCLSDSGAVSTGDFVLLSHEDMLIYTPPILKPGQYIRAYWGGLLVQTLPPYAAPIGNIEILGQSPELQYTLEAEVLRIGPEDIEVLCLQSSSPLTTSGKTYRLFPHAVTETCPSLRKGDRVRIYHRGMLADIADGYVTSVGRVEILVKSGSKKPPAKSGGVLFQQCKRISPAAL